MVQAALFGEALGRVGFKFDGSKAVVSMVLNES